MNVEETLAGYIAEAGFDDLPATPIGIARDVILTVLGTTVAGATARGCEDLVGLAREWGGREEATILIHGGLVPAHNAAFVNSAMARALDYCDAMVPGLHIGSSAVPTALAAAELAGGCSGKEFLAAIIIGADVAARLNLSESAYDGFDPTGVCGVFGAAAIAGRLLHLDSRQVLHALALAFNRSGGSFQSNIDGSLAVRVIQGFVSQNGVVCAHLARRGITGPVNFLEGIYGYYHLYGRDKFDPRDAVAGLGERFELGKTVFKKFPSCGATQSATEAVLELAREHGLRPGDVAGVDIAVTPYVHKLVGRPLSLGENPKVDAQFNIGYCVASALLRGGSRLEHFDEEAIRDPAVAGLAGRINVTPDPALDKIHHTACVVRVRLREGGTLEKRIDIAPGNPGNPLAGEEHRRRFHECVSYAAKPLPAGNVERLVSMVERLEEMPDIREMIPLLLAGHDSLD